MYFVLKLFHADLQMSKAYKCKSVKDCKPYCGEGEGVVANCVDDGVCSCLDDKKYYSIKEGGTGWPCKTDHDCEKKCPSICFSRRCVMDTCVCFC